MMSSPPSPGARRGFTLVELVLYTGLISIILVSSAQFLLVTVNASRRADAYGALSDSLRAAVAVMTVTTRNATVLYGADKGVLAVGGLMPTVTFALVNGSITVLQRGVTTVLTPPDVIVTSLQFTNRTGSVGPPVIGIDVLAASPSLPIGGSLHLVSAVTLRR